MSPELRRACKQVQELLRSSDGRDALDRHAIGCVIRNVCAQEHTYGQGAVEKIARAVGRDVDTLYQYAHVAEAWSEAEIAQLMERKSTLGVPLSFSHLVALAKVRRNRELFDTMTEHAFTGISVRKLRALIAEQRRKKDESTPLVTLARAVSACERALLTLRALDQCLSSVAALPPTPRLASLLQRAIQANASLLECSAESARHLARELQRIRAKLDPTQDAPPALARPPKIPIAFASAED